MIEQTSDDTVYVPAYDPGVVYGAWPYAEYPASYWGYPEAWGYGIGAGVLARGLWFGGGYALGRWASGNWGWGGRRQLGQWQHHQELAASNTLQRHQHQQYRKQERQHLAA